jgi:hypothetical protein
MSVCCFDRSIHHLVSVLIDFSVWISFSSLIRWGRLIHGRDSETTPRSRSAIPDPSLFVPKQGSRISRGCPSCGHVAGS